MFLEEKPEAADDEASQKATSVAKWKTEFKQAAGAQAGQRHL